jgi:hypothetical protein
VSWRRGWRQPQNPEKAAAGGAELAAEPVLCDSIREHNCLFWRAGADTAGGTGFAVIMQGKAGKIPQSEIISVCGQVETPNLDSGIWWENVKCISVNLRFIAMEGLISKNASKL